MPKGEAAEVSACSKFEEEKEILMLPWLRFRVTSIRAFDDEEQQKWQAVQAVHMAYAGSRFDPTHDAAAPSPLEVMMPSLDASSSAQTQS